MARPYLAPAEAETARLAFRVPASMRAALAADAERRGVTLSDAVREALAAWVAPDAAA